MAKVSTLQPKVGKRDSRSPDAQFYRKWYSTYRWQQHRKRHLDSSPLCVMCKRAGRITIATVADHIKPHKGDPLLFWDPKNLQSLCKPHHDSAKQSEERGSKPIQAVGVDGWPA